MGETIFALSTPTGRSGIAVIRVSGPGAYESLKFLTHKDFLPRTAALATLMDPLTQDIIDRSVVLYFQAPASFTGEDIVEYHVHGGRAVIDALLAALGARAHHRLALPGEFTRRAFENGKMDLTAAEAVADLIDAETSAQKMQALAQMEGALSRLYADWTERLKKILAHIEADIEFPDEDLPDGITPELRAPIEKISAEISVHLNDNRRGERLRDGIHVAIIGAPNAGKSSLVNALTQRDIAIVSDMPGTTRDIIEAHLNINGYPVILSDTAGLRPEQLPPFTSPPQAGGIEGGHDKIESEGIRRALARAQNADLKILLFDGAAEFDDATLNLIDENSLIAVNKIDCHSGRSEAQPRNLHKVIEKRSLGFARDDIVSISAKTGAGLDVLLKKLEEKITGIFKPGETPSLTRQRHRSALEETLNSLRRSQGAQLPELMAEDLRLAVRSLGRITGRVDVEDLLDVIFKDFCIGK